MALTVSFSISQSPLTPGIISATDTSTGVDASVTKRRITFTTNLGTTLVVSGTSTSYNDWALANTTQAFNVLTSDAACSVLVQWLDVNNNVLYSSTQSYCFAYFNKAFLYQLVQAQALTPSILQDANYNANVATFYTTIIGALNAVTFGSDIAASQACLDRGTTMRLAQSKYF